MIVQKQKRAAIVCGLLPALLLLSSTLFASETSASLKGRVVDAHGAPISGALVQLVEGEARAVSDTRGRFVLRGEIQSPAQVTVTYFGRELFRGTVEGREEPALIQVESPASLQLGQIVATTRTGDISATVLSEAEVREVPAPVTGELLRTVNGVDAVRRGPVGLDPVVRGLRETEVGVYLDGTRLFPGGPGRMDSAFSHLDPSAVHRVQVVKGPYALTWGAGNLSAIRVDTFDLSSPPPQGLAGSVLAGYQSNRDAGQLAANLFGSQGRVGYWFHGVAREASDYESGDGTLVPGDMESREIRAKLAFEINRNSQLTVAAGYQRQDDIDYPGRILDATFFDTYQFSARLDVAREFGPIQGYSALIYHNTVDHAMNNDQKPTAQPNPNRVPPFGLDVHVDSEIAVTGGRFEMNALMGDNGNLAMGLDAYHTERDALRTIARRDSGMVMFVDQMWPDAMIQDIGLFGHLKQLIGDRITTETTLRLDFVEADADSLSDFYRQNTVGDPNASETNLSGAFTLAMPLNDNLLFSFGLGSAVRTADANERYADRIASTKAQMSAEFMGNPLLEPERSNQVDLWLEGSRGEFAFSLNGFARRIDDYITLEATDLPKRLPLSPPTVFRYVNGDASFHGLDFSMEIKPAPAWRIKFAASYLDGEDRELDEPAIGVTPLTGRLMLRYQTGDRRFSLETTITGTDDQDEVAVSRGETPTDGYTTVDLQTRFHLWRGLQIHVGGLNLTDEDYVNHLNAKNPFTGLQVAEPGRLFFADLRFSF